MTGRLMTNAWRTFCQDRATSQDSAKVEPVRVILGVLGVLERMSCTLPDTKARGPRITELAI